MAIKLKSNGEYVRAIKALRHYADGFNPADGFDLRHLSNQYRNPLTRSQKAKVARYMDVLQRHAGYKDARYQHFRDPAKLASAQKAMGMPSRGSWRGVFVPQPAPETPAQLVRYKNTWIIEYRHQGVDTVFVPFDRELFATYGTSYVHGLLHGLPKDYRYNLDMGYGRNRWKAGGNLEQMLRDLEFIVSGYGNVADFVMGVHVYRGGNDAYNDLKLAQFRTVHTKRATQDAIRKVIRKERRELNDYQEFVRLSRKFAPKV